MAYRDLVEGELDVGPETLVSVDVEDYCHEVPGGEEIFRRQGLPTNLPRNLETLLDLFAGHGVTATWFVLGCVAHRIRPQLRRMVAEGHEIASHGWGHGRATWMEREEFAEDLRRARTAIEDATGGAVRGYRAPFFAVTEGNLWALDAIREAGFEWDSSVCPVKNFAYGVPGAPERPHRLTNGLVELPLSRVRLLGYRFMVGGGFYLRAYPFWFTRLLLRLRDPSLPRILYIHPWEWDRKELNPWDQGIDHPALRWKARRMRWIVTHNRSKALPRFARLLETGPTGRPIGSVVPG